MIVLFGLKSKQCSGMYWFTNQALDSVGNFLVCKPYFLVSVWYVHVLTSYKKCNDFSCLATSPKWLCMHETNQNSEIIIKNMNNRYTQSKIKYKVFVFIHGAILLHVMANLGCTSKKDIERNGGFLVSNKKGMPRWRQHNGDKTITCWEDFTDNCVLKTTSCLKKMTNYMCTLIMCLIQTGTVHNQGSELIYLSYILSQH